MDQKLNFSLGLLAHHLFIFEYQKLKFHTERAKWCLHRYANFHRTWRMFSETHYKGAGEKIKEFCIIGQLRVPTKSKVLSSLWVIYIFNHFQTNHAQNLYTHQKNINRNGLHNSLIIDFFRFQWWTKAQVLTDCFGSQT